MVDKSDCDLNSKITPVFKFKKLGGDAVLNLNNALVDNFLTRITI